MENQRTKKTTVKSSKQLPYSVETERAVLSCVLMDNEVQLEMLLSLDTDDFYLEAHKQVFTAMKEIIKGSTPLDLVTLADNLEKKGLLESVGGMEYLMKIAEEVPSTANYKSYFDMMKRDCILRKLIHAANDIIEDSVESQSSEKSVSNAEKQIFAISQKLDTGDIVSIDKVLPKVLNKFDMVNKDKTALHGIKTGFDRLDYYTNGLQNSDLILIGARPSVGKTSFGMNIIENCALNSDKTCLVFSLEMNKEQLAQRMLCSVAEISMSSAIRGELTKDDWRKIEIARGQLNKAKILIDDTSGLTVNQILSKCRRVKRRQGLDLVLVDYIGLIRPDEKRSTNTRQNEVAEISGALKALAKELNIPVIVLSQLSRLVESTDRKGGRPQLSDLRESGAIEQDADIVMFIHRPDKDKKITPEEKIKKGIKENVAEIYLDKQRNGETGMFKLFFKQSCTKFQNYVEGENDNEEPQKHEQSSVTSSDMPENIGSVLNKVGNDVNIRKTDEDDEIFGE